MKYRAVYKCRLCGKEFYGDEYCKTKVRSTQCIYLLPEIHNCETGDISFADFLGLRKVEE